MNQAYIDATIPSYLVAEPSPNPQTAERQRITQLFWSDARFEFVLSDYVFDEISAGKRKRQVAKRVEAVKELPRVIVQPLDLAFAKELINQKALPKKALIDAVHVAVTARNAIPYLATWNFTHLANPHTRPKIEQVCIKAGYSPPRIDSPDTILEEF